MKNYTDEELARVLVKTGYSKELHYKELRHILSTLPDQPDDWQAKNAEVIDVADVRIGDRVLLKSIEGSLYEVTITSITTTHEVMLRWNDGRIYESSIERAYLFNRPVQHPDPLHDLVILIHGAYGNQYDHPTAYSSDGDAYHIVGLGDSRILPQHIDIWEPAKVIPKENTND